MVARFLRGARSWRAPGLFMAGCPLPPGCLYLSIPAALLEWRRRVSVSAR
jgi:hypothetical protein